MKESITVTFKIIAGIVSILIPFYIIIYIVNDVIYIHDYLVLKWFPLLISALGFILSGFINRNSPLKLIPFLYISILLFVYLKYFYFPFFFFIILFASISLFITRKEFNKKYRLFSLVFMTSLFVFFLFSQPLIIRNEKHISYFNGNLENSKIIWDFSKNSLNMLPDDVFADINNNDYRLQYLKNKTVFVTFWATWCKGCLEEKQDLEKLKKEFANNPDVVFVDISLDDNKRRWSQYLEKNLPKGVQLITKNVAKTKILFGLNSIPEHLIIDKRGVYRKGAEIYSSSTVLLNAKNVNKFIEHKKTNIITNEFIIVKLVNKEIKELNIFDSQFYTIDDVEIYKGDEIFKNYVDDFKSSKFPKFSYFVITKTQLKNDSIINLGYIKTSDVKLKMIE